MTSREKALTSLTQPQIAVLALYLLGGEATAVDTEDVAIQVHQIAPERFCWRKYPDQINLELVRVALSDACKEANGAQASGTGKRGWALTVAGRQWAKQNLESVAGLDLGRDRQQRTSGSIAERRWRWERVRVLATNAWDQWANQHSAITHEAAAELFRVDRYVVGRSREMKVNRLREMFAEDKELAPFLETAGAVLLEED